MPAGRGCGPRPAVADGTGTSAAWVQCIAAGLPTVLTDLRHLAHIPTLEPRGWTVCHLESGGGPVAPVAISIDITDEDGLLLRALRRLIADAPLRATLGGAARGTSSAITRSRRCTPITCAWSMQPQRRRHCALRYRGTCDPTRCSWRHRSPAAWASTYAWVNESRGRPQPAVGVVAGCYASSAACVSAMRRSISASALVICARRARAWCSRADGSFPCARA